MKITKPKKQVAKTAVKTVKAKSTIAKKTAATKTSPAKKITATKKSVSAKPAAKKVVKAPVKVVKTAVKKTLERPKSKVVETKKAVVKKTAKKLPLMEIKPETTATKRPVKVITKTSVKEVVNSKVTVLNLEQERAKLLSLYLSISHGYLNRPVDEKWIQLMVQYQKVIEEVLNNIEKNNQVSYQAAFIIFQASQIKLLIQQLMTRLNKIQEKTTATAPTHQSSVRLIKELRAMLTLLKRIVSIKALSSHHNELDALSRYCLSVSTQLHPFVR